jgi:hypothetical protein
MALTLDGYIDEYLQHADEFDKKVALHLKEIIPKTVHLDKKVFKEIIEELKKEIENGKDFKAAFHKVSENHILKGDIIKAELPRFLVRIILDENEFIEKGIEMRGIPSNQVRKKIKSTVASKRRKKIARLFKNAKLSIHDVVFATFAENDMEVDLFANDDIKDVVSMLALNICNLNKDRPITAVNIKYRNKYDIVKRFPVFTDAGWYDKFYPSDKKDKYGRTKSLDPSLKNLPEVVHENLRLVDVIEEIRFLRE